MRTRLADWTGRTLFATGLDHWALGGTGVVVAFHRVNDRTAGDGLTVGVRAFEDFCRFFARHFDVVPLRDLVSRLRAREPLDRKLAITFDDGYRDNHEFAAPVLRSLGLDATFFVVSSFIDSETVAWWDRDLEEPHRWMTRQQLLSLRDQGFEIGAHTRTHADLGQIGGADAQEEIDGGRSELEEALGAPVDLFAYPYGGRANLTEENRERVRKSGFLCCLSSFGGVNRSADDPFQMRRIPVTSWYRTPHHWGADLVLGRT